MGRYTGPVCRLCRREGVKLFLKSLRCDTPKCAIERRGEAAPGQHGAARRKLSDYGQRLREKQKVKRFYGVYERQFRRYMDIAGRSIGNTGSTLMSLLERRLDNVVHRLGWAGSRRQARQLVGHGHVLVNGRRVDIPSYTMRVGDTLTVKQRPKSHRFVQQALEQFRGKVPDFIAAETGNNPTGRLVRIPAMEDVSIPVQPTLIVELLSK